MIECVHVGDTARYAAKGFLSVTAQEPPHAAPAHFVEREERQRQLIVSLLDQSHCRNSAAQIHGVAPPEALKRAAAHSVIRILYAASLSASREKLSWELEAEGANHFHLFRDAPLKKTACVHK